MISKLKYLAWAGTHIAVADRSCPACGSGVTKRICRKYLVTCLHRCENCRLMFRVPKNEPGRAERFYQNEYRQGFTSDCPTPEQLDNLIATRFSGTQKDYTGYIGFLAAARVLPGATIYDFGCSWGYGSWQLQQAGYEVVSYEISVPRASYARQHLGTRMVSPLELDHAVDCLFSAHVIEHMDNPRDLWRIADKVLKPSGRVVLFFPNGSLERASVHSTWGQVHPLLLDSAAVQVMAQASGFSALTYSRPFDLRKVAAGIEETRMTGDELAVLAVRSAEFSTHPTPNAGKR